MIAARAFDALAARLALRIGAPVERRDPGGPATDEAGGPRVVVAMGPAAIEVTDETLTGIKDCVARARLEAVAAEATRAELRTRADTVFSALIAEIESDRTIGGLVSWAEVEAVEELSADDMTAPGMVGHAATIALSYTAASHAAVNPQ